MPRAPRGSFLAAASTKLCGRQPLLVSRCCSLLYSPQQRVDAGAAFAMLVTGSRLPLDSLQTPKLSAAALHCVLLGVQECLCQPSKPETPHSGPTHCLVEALRVPFAALQTAQPLTAALHTVLFKRLNPPRRGYTLSCSGFKTAICHPSNP